jgi:hypothetical protein
MSMEAKPTIWLIYQGVEGEGLSELLELEAKTLKCRVNKTSREQLRGESVFDQVVADCTTCDAVIAVAAEDQRHASTAGNLWFEVGLWMGKRDRSLLRILRHTSVVLPSDIACLRNEAFDSEESLKTAFVRQVRDLEQQLLNSPPRSNSRKKIQAVFDTKRDTRWLQPDSYRCYRQHEFEHPCEFRESVLEFSAELLRMGRANHERHTIEDSFARVAFAGAQLLVEGLSRSMRGRYVTDLLRDRNSLMETVSAVFNTGRRSTYPDPKSTEERFVLFLKDKLACASRMAKTLSLPGPMNGKYISSRAQEVDAVWSWLQNLDSDKYKKDLHESLGNTSFTDELHSRMEFCYDASVILQSLNWHYFRTCRESLLPCLQSDRDPMDVHLVMRTAIDELPHNKGQPHLRIWREQDLGSGGE